MFLFEIDTFMLQIYMFIFKLITDICNMHFYFKYRYMHLFFNIIYLSFPYIRFILDSVFHLAKQILSIESNYVMDEFARLEVTPWTCLWYIFRLLGNNHIFYIKVFPRTVQSEDRLPTPSHVCF